MNKKFSYISEQIGLSENTKTTVINILKLGKFYDPRYDWFEITQKMFDSFIRNFSENVLGYIPPLDIGHRGDYGGGAAALYKRVFQEGTKLFAEVDWTKLGIEAVTEKGFKYISSEFNENYENNETGTNMGATLLGGGLTIRPVIKGLDPVSLSQMDERHKDNRILLSEKLINELTEERRMNKAKFLKMLSDALGKVEGLSDDLLKKLSGAAGGNISGEESKDDINALISRQVELAESIAKSSTKTLASAATTITMPKTLSAEDVAKLIQEGISSAKTAEDNAILKLSTKKTANIKLLSETVSAVEGINDDQKKTLSEGLSSSITGTESSDQIKSMVAITVKLSEEAVAKTKLAQMGFGGNVYIVEPEAERNSKQLSEKIDEIMAYDKMPDSKRYKNTGKLSDNNKSVAEKVLSLYNRVYAVQLAREAIAGHKMLAAGETGIADTALPYTVMRNVVRESMYDLQAANFIDIDIETNGNGNISPTVFIAFLKRQIGNPGRGASRVFEGKPIPPAGYKQDQEMAYVNANKMAMKFSDEVAFFTTASRIDYDAVRDNTMLLSRLVGEDVEFLLITEAAMASDEYSVVAVSAESLDAQTNASNTTFQLAQYPLVIPRKVFDLQENQVGSTLNDLVITFTGGVISEYDGSGNQSAGNYYRITNYSLGQFQIVNETGVVQVPGGADTLAVDYSYTTNIIKWDKNLPTGVTWEKHLNGLLQVFGRRKAALYQDRFSIPNFMYMSAVMNNMTTEAEKFESAKQVPGNALTNDGNLAAIKGVPAFGSNVPFAQFGDMRALIGERFTTKQKIVRPWAMESGFTQVVDPTTGQFTGEKQTYGQQYDAIHTPSLNKGKYTQVLAYDSRVSSAGGDIGPF